MDIQINTAAVSSAADQIDNLNKKLRTEMSELESAIKSLQRNWDGSAADTGINKFNYIKNNTDEARYSVINNLVSFLKIQVGENYEITEQSVSKAASAFK